MSHPQQNFTQRQFSPPQAASPSPSNATAPANFSLPPSKRPKVSPAPQQSLSQPPSPYVTQPAYAASPTSTIATPITAATLPSPIMPMNTASSTAQFPQGPFNPPQSSGRFAPMALAQPAQTQSPIPAPQIPSQSLRPAPQTFQPPNPIGVSSPTPISQQYSHAQLAPVTTPTPTPMPAAAGNMGPPATYPSSIANDNSRQQPSRSGPSKAPSYEVNDMLVGTGIDLDEEADIMCDLSSRTGFAHLPAGGSESLYGAGPANQPAEILDAETLAEYSAIAADRAWNTAAQQFALSRSQEAYHNLLEPGVVHQRILEITEKFNLGVNLDIKLDGRTQYTGKLFQPSESPKPDIKPVVQTGPDGIMFLTQGSFIPKDAHLIDQIVLLSLGTRERLRDLLSDANKIAATRQKSSHGAVPTEWADAVASPPPQMNGAHSKDTEMGGMGAASPSTNPRKRPRDSISDGEVPAPDAEALRPNVLVGSMLDLGKQSQDMEEGRLRKRQKRLEKIAEKGKEGAEGGSRSGSVGPSTSGSLAPDGDGKSLSKKEGKKAAAKAAESSSGTTVNATLNLFTGGKKKKYSWMNSNAGSGTSTPRPGQGAPGTASGNAGTSAKAGRGPLTKAGVTHLGQFREDSDKGRNIQLRDWIVTLEDRGLDPLSLQHAYDLVDRSDTGLKVATEEL